MTDTLRVAGMGWPNGAVSGGNGRILSLPSDEILLLGSEHWHYDAAVGAGKRVLFRGMARQGFRPAEVQWDPGRYVAEILRDARRVTAPITDFVAWNESNLQDERGDTRSDHGDLTDLMRLIGGFGLEVVLRLRRELPGTALHFGAFAPKDETDYIDLWRPAAEACDVIDVHAYGQGEGIVGHIQKYAALFPDKPIHLTEWHSDLNGPGMDRETLKLLAEYAAVHEQFRAYYFLWRWDGAPSHQRDLADAIAVEGNDERLALFRNPPAMLATPTDEPPLVIDPPIHEPATEDPVPEGTAMPDPYEHFALEQIVSASECPLENVRANWPRIVEQLAHCGINDRATQIAAIGTTAIETASTFLPVREAFWLSEAWRAANLRYYPWYGRGLIQITWEANYRAFGQKVDELWQAGGAIDLIARPDDAMEPDIAAAVMAVYFRDHGGDGLCLIPEAARRGDWREVRRLVQGGAAGLDRLVAIAAALEGEAPPVSTERLYGVDVPDGVIRQQDSWTCAVRTTYAALWSLADQGVGEPVTYGDGGPRDVYDWLVPAYDAPDVGLLDHTGAGLAAALREHGYVAEHAYPVSLEQVLERAGAMPVMIGGDGFNHWAYVRGRTNDGGLALENPAPGHAGIDDYLRDSWGRLGPMAMVWIEPVAVEPVSVPAPPDYATLVGVAFSEQGVVVPALAAALANPDDANLRTQVDSVLRFLRSNQPAA